MGHLCSQFEVSIARRTTALACVLVALSPTLVGCSDGSPRATVDTQ